MFPPYNIFKVQSDDRRYLSIINSGQRHGELLVVRWTIIPASGYCARHEDRPKFHISERAILGGFWLDYLLVHGLTQNGLGRAASRNFFRLLHKPPRGSKAALAPLHPDR
jgi:hypothetical protein